MDPIRLTRKCLSCGARYSHEQRDGSAYYHSCALSQAELVALGLVALEPGAPPARAHAGPRRDENISVIRTRASDSSQWTYSTYIKAVGLGAVELDADGLELGRIVDIEAPANE